MEESQKIHIETYLPELTHCTFLSTVFLCKLQAAGFLDERDLEVLEAERHDNGTLAESKHFYEILIEKNIPGTYEAIMDAVRSTHQSEALKILEKLPKTVMMMGKRNEEEEGLKQAVN